LQPGILEIDIHGMTKYQAKVFIDSRLKKAGMGVYRVRIIHGYHGGTELRDMVRAEYGKNHPRVLRMAFCTNPGETELVLREY
jgi:DNA-nicking Smr family endonuclease